MLIGFGCSVPAIMATRTIDDRRGRLTTALIIPLVSCSARFPIYALIIPAFFPRAWHAPLLWIMYVAGILLALGCAQLLRATLLKGPAASFVMELPPYRLPTFKSVLIHMWSRSWIYVKKAGTVILGASVLLWALTAFPGLPDEAACRYQSLRRLIRSNVTNEQKQKESLKRIDDKEAEEALRASFAGRIGRTIEPVLKPMGFDWKIGTALIGAFAAKEVFVSQLGIIYSIGETDKDSETLRNRLRTRYSPLTGLCIMLFCLISSPCMATVAATRSESNSWLWALFQLAGLTLLGYAVTTLVFQAGSLLGLGM
jgi:ferrous iron transport protein B